MFTVLDVASIPRVWLDSVVSGKTAFENAPSAWRTWVTSGKYLPLTSEPTTVIRSVPEQVPDTTNKIEILDAVFEHFRENPIAFEGFAGRIFRMHDRRVIIDRFTQASVDGGRDAIGRYVLGVADDPVHVEFALEAKCYEPGLRTKTINTVGVSEVSRLISRLRHRQFGVLVTTSAIARQAYAEVREDRHPIVFLCGRDIAEILIAHGCNSLEAARSFLSNEYPINRRS